MMVADKEGLRSLPRTAGLRAERRSAAPGSKP